MPTIACPKCQTKYKLPESALGKPIKCQKCGAGFRTAPPAQAKQTATPAAGTQQPSAGALAQLGIDGPLKRQADIFSSPPPPPQRGNPLGNFVIEDPGFADINTARQEVQNEEHHGDGMESIVANPYSTGSGSKKRNKKATDVDLRDYKVARIGMWIVFISWVTMLSMMIILYATSWIADLAPETFKSIAQSIGPNVAGMIGIGFLGLTFLSLGMVVLGQIICVFSPNRDEKTFAGLAVGALVAAVIIPLVATLLGALSAAAADATDVGEGAMAVIGLMIIGTVFASYALVLANMFFFIGYFKRVGKNIRSKSVVESAKVAMTVWIAAIVVAVLAGIAVFIFTLVFADNEDTMTMAVKLTGLLNAILGFSVMVTLIGMVKETIQKTTVVPS